MVTLDELRVLLMLAEEGHVGRTATRLHMSQPTVSKSLAKAERRVGLALFDRHPGGVRITDAGKRLVEQARRVIDEADRFAHLAKQLRGDTTDVIRIGFVGQAANEHTAAFVAAFHRSNLDIRVELQPCTLRDVIGVLQSEALDAALVRWPLTAPGLRHHVVLREPRVAVLPTTHRLLDQDQLALAQLLDEPWVVADIDDPAYQAYAMALTARNGRPPARGPTIGSIQEYHAAVAAGAGIGLAPASAARYYADPRIAYRPVVDAEPSQVAVCWFDRNARHRQIIAQLIAAFEEVLPVTI